MNWKRFFFAGVRRAAGIPIQKKTWPVMVMRGNGGDGRCVVPTEKSRSLTRQSARVRDDMKAGVWARDDTERWA
jgi:hypothetical protein